MKGVLFEDKMYFNCNIDANVAAFSAEGDAIQSELTHFFSFFSFRSVCAAVCLIQDGTTR